MVNDSNEPLTGVLVWTDKADPSYTGVDGKFNINATPGLVSVFKVIGKMLKFKNHCRQGCRFGANKDDRKAILIRKSRVSATHFFKSTVKAQITMSARCS
ncbi:MAG: hypothetical protein IPL08_13365 [Saprospiraceae bacterium]|nr:hypothetical protein [Saprospiraceae bacterium]